VAVSKFHPVEAIMEAYGAGQRLFGENRPQELSAKQPLLPSDIEWHFLGHLQTNKLKQVLPYASLVQSVDSVHLLDAIEKWASLNGRQVRILLELHLGAEETKHGFTEQEILSVLGRTGDWPHVVFCGLMGMATNTPDESVIAADFRHISDFKKKIDQEFAYLKDFHELSIGMSGDWKIALSYGATIVRIGTSIFGQREY